MYSKLIYNSYICITVRDTLPIRTASQVASFLNSKCRKMNITNKAKSLINIESKVWLCEALGISRVTLDNRLEKDNWKKLEIERLIKL